MNEKVRTIARRGIKSVGIAAMTIGSINVSADLVEAVTDDMSDGLQHCAEHLTPLVFGALSYRAAEKRFPPKDRVVIGDDGIIEGEYRIIK